MQNKKEYPVCVYVNKEGETETQTETVRESERERERRTPRDGITQQWKETALCGQCPTASIHDSDWPSTREASPFTSGIVESISHS